MDTYETATLALNILILVSVIYLISRLPHGRINAKQRPILVDTSVLIDGRITGIAASGFVGGTLVIPRSVVGELQLLADNADPEKRSRARRGLDVVSELQAMKGVDVDILQDGARANEGVDNRLISLAKKHGAAIATVDYNLNKVAVVEDIKVLNINELAQGLRMRHLPGEHTVVELTGKGQDSHQAVGHLADGTMVVVEQASGRIGQTVEVEVIRSLQTAAGRMMFARIIDKSVRTQSQTARSGKSVVKHLQKPAAKAPTSPQNKTQSRVSSTTKPNAQGKRSATVRLEQTNAPASKTAHQQQQPRRSHQPPRRRDREATLIDLVEKQP